MGKTLERLRWQVACLIMPGWMLDFIGESVDFQAQLVALLQGTEADAP